ncbi:MAG: flagellar hook-associated protein FlgL [Methylotenera sp.]|uniref:flagellar hook-associated protein FlgL n=1 Tax=Methylotenera sp. TaxID=2051956 RepID=UPI0017D2297B|nr:flagellar hook-associated protein FlgL [Methylotenera sp.]NOU25064.1 flagellar hook-associated protein FlgL [Methylotenera sp.]
MRISTNTIYQSGISKINNLQTEQVKLQQQISTGKRLASPSDDPVASARALEVSHAQGINDKFADTRKTAQLKLNTLESNLTSVTNLLISTQSSLVAAGNGSLSNLERSFIGTELNGSLEQLIGLANTQDASGNYLYAGFKTSTKPFDAAGTYAGDSNQQLLQVDSQRQMAVNVTGNAVFQAGGNDAFAALKDIVTLLNTPITDATSQAAFSTGIATALGKMRGAVDNVLNVRADIGTKLNEIDKLDTAGSDRSLQYSKSLSELQDTDYASALSDLAKQQTIMEAAQKSFVQVTSLSLFKFI